MTPVLVLALGVLACGCAASPTVPDDLRVSVCCNDWFPGWTSFYPQQPLPAPYRAYLFSDCAAPVAPELAPIHAEPPAPIYGDSVRGDSALPAMLGVPVRPISASLTFGDDLSDDLNIIPISSLRWMMQDPAGNAGPSSALSISPPVGHSEHDITVMPVRDFRRSLRNRDPHLVEIPDIDGLDSVATVDEQVDLIRVRLRMFKMFKKRELYRPSYSFLLSLRCMLRCLENHCGGRTSVFRQRWERLPIRTFPKYCCTGREGFPCRYLCTSKHD